MVRVERPTAEILLVTIDRPERRNAVDIATLEGLVEAFEPVRPDETRVVVLTGAPPAFCAGADLGGAESDAFHEALGRALQTIAQCPVPVIASVDGPALGAGSQLVSVCDLRVATERSIFGIPAAKLGLAVDQWTVDRLVREFGWGIARAMLVAAEVFTAERMFAAGVIHRIGGLDSALDWAHVLAGQAPLTVIAHKAALDAAAPPSISDGTAEALRRAAWASRDAEEGRTAFLEKRPARFTAS
jgi:enoyl-CoA hydratase